MADHQGGRDQGGVNRIGRAGPTDRHPCGCWQPLRKREDRALERRSNLTGGAAGKVVATLLAEDMVATMKKTGWQ
jgi:hypothetical protein